MNLKKINLAAVCFIVNVIYSVLVLRTCGVYFFNNDDSMALFVGGFSTVFILAFILGMKSRPMISYTGLAATVFMMWIYYTVLLTDSGSTETTIFMQFYSFANFILLFLYLWTNVWIEKE